MRTGYEVRAGVRSRLCIFQSRYIDGYQIALWQTGARLTIEHTLESDPKFSIVHSDQVYEDPDGGRRLCRLDTEARARDAFEMEVERHCRPFFSAPRCVACGYSRLDTLDGAEWLGIDRAAAICCEMPEPEPAAGFHWPDVHTGQKLEFEGAWYE